MEAKRNRLIIGKLEFPNSVITYLVSPLYCCQFRLRFSTDLKQHFVLFTHER